MKYTLIFVLVNKIGACGVHRMNDGGKRQAFTWVAAHSIPTGRKWVTRSIWVSMRRSTARPILLQAPPSHLSHVFRAHLLNKCSVEGKEKDQAGNTCGQQASYTTTSFKSP